MSTSVLRNSLRRTPLLRRHVASVTEQSSISPKKPVPSASTLPSAKMRALIALYHQTDTFITPENLSAAIDHAFIDKLDVKGAFTTSEQSYADLRARMADRRILPKVGGGKDALMDSQASRYSHRDDELWSDMKLKRDAQVINALWGIEYPGRPGLEMVEDESQRIQEELKRQQGKH